MDVQSFGADGFIVSMVKEMLCSRTVLTVLHAQLLLL